MILSDHRPLGCARQCPGNANAEIFMRTSPTDVELSMSSNRWAAMISVTLPSTIWWSATSARLKPSAA